MYQRPTHHGNVYGTQDWIEFMECYTDEEGGEHFKLLGSLWGSVYPMISAGEEGAGVKPDSERGVYYRMSLYGVKQDMFRHNRVHVAKWNEKTLTIVRSIMWPSHWIDIVTLDRGGKKGE